MKILTPHQLSETLPPDHQAILTVLRTFLSWTMKQPTLEKAASAASLMLLDKAITSIIASTGYKVLCEPGGDYPTYLNTFVAWFVERHPGTQPIQWPPAGAPFFRDEFDFATWVMKQPGLAPHAAAFDGLPIADCLFSLFAAAGWREVVHGEDMDDVMHEFAYWHLRGNPPASAPATPQ
jgi:hypothetical protein